MAALQSWRKAFGALKDSTTVGLANLNSDFKELDVAIVKATNHVECPPKERHLRKILAATSITRPRADVVYCIQALARRLSRTHNWTVALKTLIVIHRTLREGDPTFREELLAFSQRGHILQLSNFKDDSSPIAWDCSAWIRTYALYLEERLECFMVLKYDVEAERLVKPVQGSEKSHSRTRELDAGELLNQLPALQQLLYRLVGCRPDGASSRNYVVQYTLALVLKESFKIYCSINDGIINVVDKFFDMPRHEAIKALEIYKRAGQQAGSLSDFYGLCRGLEVARNFQFPNLREPPQSFVTTMEEYISEAPRVVSVSTEPLEFPERLLLTYKPQEVVSPTLAVDVKPKLGEHKSVPSDIEVASPLRVEDTGDLLNLIDMHPNASAIEESNAWALEIVPLSGATVDPSTMQEKRFDPSGWELALVTDPTDTNSSVVESQFSGGLDKFTLDSLCNEASYRQQQQQSFYGTAAPNPFLTSDPFAMSNQFAAPPAFQMAAMAQQQQRQQQHMSMMMQPNPFPRPFHQQPVFMGGTSNPFLDPAGFGAIPPSSNPQHQSNPFGNGQLL